MILVCGYTINGHSDESVVEMRSLENLKHDKNRKETEQRNRFLPN